jgi:uncharacterized protein
MDIRKWTFFCVLILLGAPAHAASFDCKKASSKTEKMICKSDELSHLDTKLAEAYQATYVSFDQTDQEQLLIAQRAWLGAMRAKCDDEECIATSYDARIDQLKSLAKSGLNKESPKSLKYWTRRKREKFLMTSAAMKTCLIFR